MSSARRSRILSSNNSRNAQKTILFSGSRVTKPAYIDSLNLKSKFQAKSIPIAANLHSIKPGLTLKSKSEINKKYTDEEQQAFKVNDSHISQYWKKRESENIASNVHQSELHDHVKILRLFDISSQYGPCIGISRSERWSRANRLGLSPPIEVLAILMKQNINNIGNLEQAYVDELLI